MPPPPMVPGKHNLDVNTWDVPNNNPPPVPSPPPPIDICYAEASVNFNAGYAADNDIGAGAERAHNVGIDYQRDDNKSNYSNSRDNNFGRVRNSPNGHTRKNWPVQHPLHHNRQQQHPSSSSDRAIPSQTGGPIRRNDGAVNAGAVSASGGTNRYTYDRDRKSHYGAGNGGGLRSDNSEDNFRDENTTRNVSTTQSNDLESGSIETPQAVLEELRDKNNYNPADIDLEKAAAAR